MLFNTLKTIALLLALSLLLIAVGSFFGPSGMQIALVMACIMNGFMYFFSDRLVLRLHRAQSLDEYTYKTIHDMVAELAARMHMPTPKLWLVDSPVANAFATGRNPSHASVALTTGIIDILDEDELQGVLAHELSHVKNRDIFISTMAATIATTISYLAYMLRHSALWGSFSSRRRSSNNPLVLFIVGLILPFIATLVQLAISRSREYQADEMGAKTTHDPLALASALKKLQLHTQHAKQKPAYAPAMALGIVHPLKGHKLLDLLSTHPPMDERIKRLEQLHQKLF